MIDTEFIKVYLKRNAASLSDILKSLENSCFDDLEEAISLIYISLSSGGRLLVCGNGGSAADAQHLTSELVATFARGESRKPLSAICLSADIATITAYANDYDFDKIFSRQVEAHGRKGDCLLAISTSGKSKNVIEAVKAARKIEMKSISITGLLGAELAKQSDVTIQVPSKDTQIIQNVYQFLIHVMCFGIEELITASVTDPSNFHTS